MGGVHGRDRWGNHVMYCGWGGGLGRTFDGGGGGTGCEFELLLVVYIKNLCFVHCI